ncbi:MAG TPA: orotidine-5'-phosphate decarboxylase [Actinomycetota bacterium]|nr:orotidine-5'-phosphate decarboxylase [Actinomycetota bacterium]
MIELGSATLATPLCVALDSNDRSQILKTAEATQPHAGMFKVGLTAFATLGPDLVRELRDLRPVFVDLKLHDIPAQVSGAVSAVAGSGAAMTTVHASGGAEMIAAAVAASRQADGFTVAAVTVLTSLDADALREIGLGEDPADTVGRLADVAVRAGAGALVCSPLEAEALRARFGSRAQGGPVLVVPGVRPADSRPADQRRTSTPRAAIGAGADILVVGRPITSAPDPGTAARKVLEEIEA